MRMALILGAALLAGGLAGCAPGYGPYGGGGYGGDDDGGFGYMAGGLLGAALQDGPGMFAPSYGGFDSFGPGGYGGPYGGFGGWGGGDDDDDD